MAININNPLNPKANPQQKKGSGFVNLNRILDANANNRLGQAIGTGIKSGAEQVKGDIGQLKTGFESESQKQNLASDVNKQAASQALMNIGAGNTNVSDDTTKQFGTFLAGQYAGPTELDASKTAQVGARANEIQGFGQALGSQGDKTKVLQAFVGQGPYSAGQQRLDASLLGKGPNVQQLKEAQQQSRGLTQQVGREQEVARQIGQLRENQAKQFAQDVGNQITGQKTGIEGSVQSELDRLSGVQGNLYDTIKNKLSSGESLTPEERQLLGLADSTGSVENKMPGLPGQQAPLMDIYNLDATKFLNKADLSKGNVASALQKAQLEALSKLGQKDIRDFTDIDTKAGQFDPNKPLTFDRETLKKQADILKQQYEAERRDLPVGSAAAEALGGPIEDEGNNSQYNYTGITQSFPDLRGKNAEQASNELAGFENKILGLKAQLESPNWRSSDTKRNNLMGVVQQILGRIGSAKQKLNEQESVLNQKYGIGRKI